MLDPWHAVSADYMWLAPRRADFSLAAPYQAPRSRSGTPEEARDGAAGSPRADTEPAAAAAAAAAAAVAAAQPDGGSIRQRRKRVRSSSTNYQPNQREQQAAARHAEYAPLLAAAATAVQEWLSVLGAATLQQALGGAAVGAAGGRETGQVQQQQQQQQQGQYKEQQAEAGATGEEGGSTSSGGSSSDDGSSQAEPDYVAMYELRHALKPKLRFAVAPAAAEGARQAQPAPHGGMPQDVQQPPAPSVPPAPPPNLFNRLIACPGGDGGAAERRAWAGGHPVVLPPRSRLLLSDARQLQPLVDDVAGRWQQARGWPGAIHLEASACQNKVWSLLLPTDLIIRPINHLNNHNLPPTWPRPCAAIGGYQCILLDPPWENKSAKRSARYPTLPSRNLLALPLRQLMHAVRGCRGGRRRQTPCAAWRGEGGARVGCIAWLAPEAGSLPHSRRWLWHSAVPLLNMAAACPRPPLAMPGPAWLGPLHALKPSWPLPVCCAGRLPGGDVGDQPGAPPPLHRARQAAAHACMHARPPGGGERAGAKPCPGQPARRRLRLRQVPERPAQRFLSLPNPAFLPPAHAAAELLPGWGLRHLATWHWLKVTDGGQPVGRLVSGVAWH